MPSLARVLLGSASLALLSLPVRAHVRIVAPAGSAGCAQVYAATAAANDGDAILAKPTPRSERGSLGA
jgi:hypothetical protein